MSCLGLYFVPSSLACHVYFILCSIMSLRCFIFRLSFIFSYILHPSCIIFYSYSFSLLPFDSFIYSWQKEGEYTKVYIGVFHHLYDLCTFLGGEILLCAHSYGEKAIGEMHIPRGRRHSFIRKPCFVLFCFTLCLFSRFFMVLWVTFSIYTLLLSSHRVYVLDMHTSLCYCTLLIACSDDHLLCYMIIVVISTWLFCVWSKLHVSHHVYLIAIYLLHYTCLFITWFTLRV